MPTALVKAEAPGLNFTNTSVYVSVNGEAKPMILNAAAVVTTELSKALVELPVRVLPVEVD
jgi:hypothetical protein